MVTMLSFIKSIMKNLSLTATHKEIPRQTTVRYRLINLSFAMPTCGPTFWNSEVRVKGKHKRKQLFNRRMC